MKGIRISIIVVLLVAFQPIIKTDVLTRLNQLQTSLGIKIDHFKTCLRGNIRCTPQEIWNARRNLGVFTALMAIVISVSTAYHQEWGPFKDKKLMRTLTNVQKKTDALAKNPTPKNQNAVLEETQKLTSAIQSNLNTEEQQQLNTVVAEQLQQLTLPSDQTPSSPLPPVILSATPPTITMLPTLSEASDPQAIAIKTQLKNVYKASNAFLDNPNDTTFAFLQNQFKEYLMAIKSYDQIKLTKLLNETIPELSSSGNTILGKVRGLLKNKTKIIQDMQRAQSTEPVVGSSANLNVAMLNSAAKDLKLKIELYQREKTEANLIAMHKAAWDVRKVIYPAPLSMLASDITIDPLLSTEINFLKLVKKDRTLLQQLQKYPGWKIYIQQYQTQKK